MPLKLEWTEIGSKGTRFKLPDLVIQVDGKGCLGQDDIGLIILQASRTHLQREHGSLIEH